MLIYLYFPNSFSLHSKIHSSNLVIYLMFIVSVIIQLVKFIEVAITTTTFMINLIIRTMGILFVIAVIILIATNIIVAINNFMEVAKVFIDFIFIDVLPLPFQQF